MGCGATKQSTAEPEPTSSPVVLSPKPPAGLLKRSDTESSDPRLQRRGSMGRKKSVMFESDMQTMAYLNGDSYKGVLRNGLRHGFGALNYSNNDKYEGEWEDDLRHGHGVFTWHTGDVYDGQYERDLRCGQGVLTTNTGDEYDGQWLADQRHGTGVSKTINRNLDGSTSHIMIYEGEWEEDLPHGHGVQEVDRRAEDGHMAGYVPIIERYDGAWRSGRKHGRCELTYSDGRKFAGEIVASEGASDLDLRMVGTLLYPNGDSYEGELVQHRPSGVGTMRFAQGEIREFKGHFRDGKLHGPGQQTLRTGSVQSGEWVNGTWASQPPGSVDPSL
eukprot:TRINITY_DN7306_c0_g1_i1.p1 TRINITY_DN7306_c0_g1~~TRINITY_DN7306_c0_g1_i1.p1  ORF type:complete len:331 (+),score=31.54 TRINITY_DN7306_c0_g1_i1:81-1073(+)